MKIYVKEHIKGLDKNEGLVRKMKG